MKKKLFIIILLLTINLNILNATTGQLKSASIIKCDEVLYGTHGSDNHYHLAEETTDGKYKAVGDSLGSNWTCKGTLKNINEDKILEKVKAKFEKCVDGDTAVFNINGTSTKFRFLAVDTPETIHPTKKNEEFGKNASEYTCNKIKKAESIEIEYEDEKLDKYGRSLGWIWLDGSLLQKELIEIGYAEVAYIYGNYKYTQELCNIQTKAIENGYGIWSLADRKEGYCSTLRETPETKKTIAVTEKDVSEDKQKDYTLETTITTITAVLIVLIKALKK